MHIGAGVTGYGHVKVTAHDTVERFFETQCSY